MTGESGDPGSNRGLIISLNSSYFFVQLPSTYRSTQHRSSARIVFIHSSMLKFIHLFFNAVIHSFILPFHSFIHKLNSTKLAILNSYQLKSQT